jgi:hypothetical protein
MFGDSASYTLTDVADASQHPMATSGETSPQESISAIAPRKSTTPIAQSYACWPMVWRPRMLIVESTTSDQGDQCAHCR